MQTKVIAAVVGVVLVSATAAAWAGGAFEAPRAGIVDEGEWGNVTEERTEVVTTVWVDNPNPVVEAAGTPVSVAYSVRMNGVTLADGERGLSLRQGNQTKEIVVALRNDRLQEWWVAYVSNDETIRTDIEATASGGVGPAQDSFTIEREATHLANETPMIDAVEGAVAGLEGTYTGGDGDAVLEVREVTAAWGAVEETRTSVELRATVHNPTDEPLSAAAFEDLAVTVDANDVTLVDVDRTAADLAGVDADDTIAPGETRTVTLSVPVDNDRVDDWFRTHVRNDERTNLDVQVRATVEDPDTGTPVTVPAGGATYDCEFQTAILVDATPETSCDATA